MCTDTAKNTKTKLDSALIRALIQKLQQKTQFDSALIMAPVIQILLQKHTFKWHWTLLVITQHNC